MEQRQRKKDALRDWLSSQPNEILVESLMRGVLSPSTLAEIVKAARKAYDEEHGNKPNYKNLQVDGNVDGVKSGVNGFESTPVTAVRWQGDRLRACSSASRASSEPTPRVQ